MRAVLWVDEATENAWPTWKCGECDETPVRCARCPAKRARESRFAGFEPEELADARAALSDAHVYTKPWRRPAWWTFAWIQMVNVAALADVEFERERLYTARLAAGG